MSVTSITPRPISPTSILLSSTLVCLDWTISAGSPHRNPTSMPGCRWRWPSSCRRFHDVGDFGRLDLEEFLALGKALPLLLEPADNLALGHRQAPFRHRDRRNLRA